MRSLIQNKIKRMVVSDMKHSSSRLSQITRSLIMLHSQITRSLMQILKLNENSIQKAEMKFQPQKENSNNLASEIKTLQMTPSI